MITSLYRRYSFHNVYPSLSPSRDHSDPESKDLLKVNGTIWCSLVWRARCAGGPWGDRGLKSMMMIFNTRSIFLIWILSPSTIVNFMPQGYKRVQAKTTIPIAGGECSFMRWPALMIIMIKFLMIMMSTFKIWIPWSNSKPWRALCLHRPGVKLHFGHKWLDLFLF